MNAKNLRDLARTLFEEFACEDPSEIIRNEYNDKIKNYKKHIGIGSKYFFGHLHDSHILSCMVNKGNLHLKINEIATCNFAYALIEKMNLKINPRKLIFPLEIISENTDHLSLNIVDKNGKIFENDFVKLNDYISEEIIECTENNIKIAFNLYSKNAKYAFGEYINCRNYLLLLSCSKLTMTEKQHIYWERYFGDKYDKYYNLFLEERKKERPLSDSYLCMKFLEEIM